MLKLIFQFFDRKQKKINSFLKEELDHRANFEILKFPSEILNSQIKVIQFYKETQFGTIAGLGADRSIEKAYLKAIVEYYERLAYFENENQFNLQSTNGIAAHRMNLIAKLSARNELFERDSFLRHWYTNTPFENIPLNANEQIINLELASSGLEILLARTKMGFKETIICFLIIKKSGGFAIGLSTGRGKEDRTKAIQEALINYFFGHQGYSVEEQIKIVNEEGVKSLIAHRAFWLYKNPLPEWVFAATKNQTVDSNKKIFKKFEYKELSLFPFKVVHCENTNLIPLRVGDICKIYPEGLSKFQINIVSGNTQYHPIP